MRLIFSEIFRGKLSSSPGTEWLDKTSAEVFVPITDVQHVWASGTCIKGHPLETKPVVRPCPKLQNQPNIVQSYSDHLYQIRGKVGANGAIYLSFFNSSGPSNCLSVHLKFSFLTFLKPDQPCVAAASLHLTSLNTYYDFNVAYHAIKRALNQIW